MFIFECGWGPLLHLFMFSTHHLFSTHFLCPFSSQTYFLIGIQLYGWVRKKQLLHWYLHDSRMRENKVNVPLPKQKCFMGIHQRWVHLVIAMNTARCGGPEQAALLTIMIRWWSNVLSWLHPHNPLLNLLLTNKRKILVEPFFFLSDLHAALVLCLSFKTFCCF